ncbi:hypothetical protein [Nocardia nepalensis]|uniref:hypothetical protein n=1 Tax=Nocardia nepalensis TaxID=3375448 RepID=UPI003B67982B
MQRSTLAITLRILDALGLTLVSMPHADARTQSGSTAELRAAPHEAQTSDRL